MQQLAVERKKSIEYFAPEKIGEFFQAGGLQNINEKSMIIRSYLRLIEAILYKPSLTHAARGDKNKIIAVCYRMNQSPGFFLAVAEIFGHYAPGHDKGIYRLHHTAKLII